MSRNFPGVFFSLIPNGERKTGCVKGPIIRRALSSLDRLSSTAFGFALADVWFDVVRDLFLVTFLAKEGTEEDILR